MKQLTPKRTCVLERRSREFSIFSHFLGKFSGKCSGLSSLINVLMQLVLLVGTKLQHIIATLALESAGIPEFFPGAKLKPRDELFWFKKPELLLSLIHFVLFQVGNCLLWDT